jgi:biopolymer transport protein ExbB
MNNMLIRTRRHLMLLLLCWVHGMVWAQSAAEDSPYGLQALWLASDTVTKAVLLLLLLMSCGSWYVLLLKAWALRSMDAHCQAARENFWQAQTVAKGMALLDARSPLRFIAASCVQAAEPQSGLLTHVPPADWISMRMQRAVEAVQRDLHDGLAFLATVGSVSPFVGLFGTVWGIYHALTAIGMSGQASIDKVAGPVGEALIMTALGLAVAVPAVLAYNWLLSRNKLAMADVRAFANDLHAVVAGSRSQT